ncbi:hypothetical protein TRIATDRAFT_89328 [Trichoderma atroviride IMI 206040]|uniref:Uncharacterized protein n=1 Tax=Hypocrea atroviridis (strain ATCC 20476 / IMI 206040) TaxID=452589 RepID=G9PAZ5_HYPAI|nr:uncharacterized protein TRIATDRAFT_89328 [Trichoderma atroviride IMI 206040]EHK40176.1 hypothetical protein TRIATDRAFT_89328 [Trichoderma atroviride IMI 206040]
MTEVCHSSHPSLREDKAGMRARGSASEVDPSTPWPVCEVPGQGSAEAEMRESGGELNPSRPHPGSLAGTPPTKQMIRFLLNVFSGICLWLLHGVVLGIFATSLMDKIDWEYKVMIPAMLEKDKHIGKWAWYDFVLQ